MALFTRFFVFQPGSHLDMPDDMRIVNKQVSSIFCSSHMIDSYLIDTSTDTTKTNEYSNTLPEFDVYLFDENPAERNVTTIKKPFSVQGVGMPLSHGMHEYHSFNFLEKSHIRVSVCTQYCEDMQRNLLSARNTSDIHGLYVYFLKGQNRLDDYLAKIKSNPDEPPCTGKDCPEYINVLPSKECFVGFERPRSTLTAVADGSDEYFVLYVNADQTRKDLVSFIQYNTSRVEYDLSNVSLAATRTTKYTVRPNKYILLHFNYTQNVAIFGMHTVKTKYVCESNTLIYICIFFLVPLAAIIIFGIAFVCCQEKRDPGYSIRIEQAYQPEH
jgi:hypothetical protein